MGPQMAAERFFRNPSIYSAIKRSIKMHIFLFATILQTLPNGIPLGSEAVNRYAKKPAFLISRLLAAVFTTCTEQHSVWQLAGLHTSVVRLCEEALGPIKIVGSTRNISRNYTVEDLQTCYCSLLISGVLKSQVTTFHNRGRKRVM
jgi:hypothetical protein